MGKSNCPVSKLFIVGIGLLFSSTVYYRFIGRHRSKLYNLYGKNIFKLKNKENKKKKKNKKKKLKLKNDNIFDPTDPLFMIRYTTKKVCKNMLYVNINYENLLKYCEKLSILLNNSKIIKNNNLKNNLNNNKNEIESYQILNEVTWDSPPCHYFEDASTFGPLTCQYIFVLDTLNFCFWPTNGLEYIVLASKLRDQLYNNKDIFSCDNLININEEILSTWFDGYELPQLSERVLKLKELGFVLKNYFSGNAINMVKKAKHSAKELVKIILKYLPGFRDTSIYNGEQVFLYKRAQILVGDVWAAYGKNICNIDDINNKNIQFPYFYDIDQLTMFADYRVPQILRAEGILNYNDDLSNRIDNKIEILSGSKEEVEIRAATIQIVELLKYELYNKYLISIKPIELDWLLWQKGEEKKDQYKPHHRTLTIFY